MPASPASLASPASPASPASAVVTAAELLALWWSRPVEDEVAVWVSAAGTESGIRCGLTGNPKSGDAHLPYAIDQVPALLDEYERLFVGPGQVPCPPYESFWRDDVPIDLWHSLIGPCTAELRSLYRDIGIDMAPGAGELPDHVAVEFEALAYALSRPDGSQVAGTLICDHLSQWLPRLCRSVAAEAGHPFYAELAVVTLDWLGHIQRLAAPSGAAEPGTPR